MCEMPAPPINNLNLGPFTLHLYGLILGIAIVAAVQLLDRTMGWQNLNRDRLMPIVLPATVSGIVGARIYHVLSKPRYYMDHPVESLQIWHGGLGIYGAIIGGVAVGLWLARRSRMPLLPLLDAAAPCWALGQAIGRWGNYVNQELFGKPTSLPWGLKVDREFRPDGYADHATYHPTFLYESLWCLLLAGALLFALRRWHSRPAGVVFAIYLAAYSLERLFVEHLRIDPAHHFGGLRQNEWVALAVFALSALAALTMWRRQSEV
jgi:prolipoprotein diacylglyceryl transferase